MSSAREIDLDQTDFSELDALRTRLGLSQNEICRRAAINPSTYTRWRKWAAGDGGHRPHSAHMKCLRDVVAQELALASQGRQAHFPEIEVTMNQHARPHWGNEIEAPQRRLWTAREIAEMIAAGIIQHGEPYELLGGDLIRMAAKGARHERIKILLNRHLGKNLPEGLMLAPESVLRLGEYDEPEPEFFVFPQSIAPEDVRGDTVLLVIEIAESSLDYDLGMKAKKYAAFGVRDYWVIDARTMTTHVHRKPDAGEFRKIEIIPHDAQLAPQLIAGLSLRLSDLGLFPSE